MISTTLIKDSAVNGISVTRNAEKSLKFVKIFLFFHLQVNDIIFDKTPVK